MELGLNVSCMTSTCAGRSIIRSEKSAEKALLDILKQNNHNIVFDRLSLDAIENKYNSFVFKCSLCKCEFHLHTEGLTFNCVIIKGCDGFYDCSEIIMHKVCS